MAEDEVTEGAEQEQVGEEEDVEPPEAPMEGDVQLSLSIGGVIANRNARKVDEAVIVLQGGERTIDKLLSADVEYDLLVRVLPDMPKPVGRRDAKTNRIASVKMRQTVQTQHVQRADTEDALVDLFERLLERDRGAAERVQDRLEDARKAHLAAVA